jgi:DNA topoisomerase-1
MDAVLQASQPPVFEARLIKFRGEELDIPSGDEAARIVAELEKAAFVVASVNRREKRRYALPPFTTSKLQQEAWNKLRFTAKRTMALAQRLYEGRELGEEGSVGLITYMRTDSTRVSQEALASVREFIAGQFGSGFVPATPNVFKSKKDQQDAHEAIRPTEVSRSPESVKPYLERDEYLLYRLIWQRFVASQMVPALYDQTSLDITAGEYLFRATGSVLKFPGFLAVYHEGHDEKEIDEDEEQMKHKLPVVAEGERLALRQFKPEQHFTEPPPRYSEGTLVKELEEKGIGRPSTYAMILSTIQEREYVRKEEGRFLPTQLGEIVNDLLVKSFEDVFDVGYTARMEAELDEIEEGKVRWREVIGEFYERFEKDLDRAGDEMANYKAGIPTKHKCEKCGKPMLERLGRHGFFLACSGYPECTNTRDLGSDLANEELESEVGEEYCENCGRPMTIKRGRFGAFLACTGYPECKTTRRLQRSKGVKREPVFLDEKCPNDGGQLVVKYGRYGEFVACANYPKCKFTKPKSLGIACPKCGQGQLCEKRARKGRRRVFYGCDRYPDCDYTVWDRPIAETCPDCKAPFLLERKVKGEIARFCANKDCTYRILITPQPTPEPVASRDVGST